MLDTIHPLTDDVPSQWNKALDGARTLDELRAVVTHWRPLCEDAFNAVQEWSDDDFALWRKVLRMERRGRFMGSDAMERFGAVLMPGTMFKVSITAHQFHVPWGLAYCRLRDTGRIVERDGVARMA
jgi:hypothetical protein